MNPTPSWKAQRKLVHQFLGPLAMPLYHPVVESSAYDIVQGLITQNKEFTTEVT